MDSRFELRRSGNELVPLAILALTSMLLVGGMAFAVQEIETSVSVAESARVILGSLTLGVVTFVAFLLSLGRPRDVTVTASATAISIDDKQIRPTSIRCAYAIRDGDRWSVELERLFDTIHLLTPDRDAAERIVGALRGSERAPVAAHRLRQKAHYLLFSSTCIAWICVSAGLVAFAFTGIPGVILTAVTLPPAIWVTLKAVPTTVLVEPDALTLLHPLALRSIPHDEILGSRVVNDDAVELRLATSTLTLTELANHPRDAEARTSAPPAERFAGHLAQLATAPG